MTVGLFTGSSLVERAYHASPYLLLDHLLKRVVLLFACTLLSGQQFGDGPVQLFKAFLRRLPEVPEAAFQTNRDRPLLIN